MTDTPTPIPAATVVVFRDRSGTPPEVLMVERATTMAFAGGAMVFPGGRVDAGDVVLAAELGLDDDDGAGRIAAIREAIEEAGVAPGITPGDSETIARLRHLLHDGSTMGAALASVGASIDPDALVPFARWLPLGMRDRIFDTRFYIARLPADAPAPSVDRTENSRLLWTTAAAMLAQADAGRATIIFPTRRNLERLALFADFDAAAAQARAYPVRTITPWFEEREGARHLCIPDDLGYPVTAEPADTVRRS